MPHKDPETARAYFRERYLSRRDRLLEASAERNRAAGKVLCGPKHGLSATREYKIWDSIKQRCLNPSAPGFAGYGGRGVRMYAEWVNDAPSFIQYVVRVLGPRPSPQHTIDRIDNDGHYEPGNLRWASKAEQARNRRDTKLTPIEVEIIRHWRTRGHTHRAIAAAFCITHAHVQQICNGKAWVAPAGAQRGEPSSRQ